MKFAGTVENIVRFSIGGMSFDYDRIELYDEAHSEMEDCYDTIGDTSAGNLTIFGNLQDIDRIDDILFVVYTERIIVDEGGKSEEVIRLISARLATRFEMAINSRKAIKTDKKQEKQK